MIEDASEEHVLFAEVDILRELPQSELEYLATRCSIVHLGKKESLTLGGDRRGVLFLISGRVRVHEATFGNQDLAFSVVESATVVGQTTSTPRPLRVEALEPSVLRVLEWEDFENFVLRNPKVGLKMIRLLSERLDAYEGRLVDVIRKEVSARLAVLLLRLSERKVATPGDRRIPAHYIHRQLASMVGSNSEAVTRALGVVRKAGAVETRNRQICVKDAAALECFAGVVR